MDDHRPNPENLLKAIERYDDGKRGRLRVFLGMCPGVGKTYAMLRAATEEANRGTQVLVGVVETHGRKETEAVLAGLKILPLKKIEHKGTILTELDVDAVIREKPSLVLVDELAHTNAPGSRHTKRYQDVEEILSKGIDVFTTLNIQHIESRNESVAQITGVAVRETVPDAFLETANQIEVIDLSPSELLQRLKEGKVYLGDRAERAAQNFFKEEKLTALRELALRFTAEKVDQDLLHQMTIKGVQGPWNINERLLVAVSQSPYSARLIRAARRMAYSLEAPWIALYVKTQEPLNAEDQEMLQKNLNLARELGAELITLADIDIVDAIQKICREKNVTQIIMGRPDRRFIRDFLARGNLLDHLVKSISNIDVHVIRAERPPRYRGFHFPRLELKSSLLAYYYTAWFLGLISVFCYAATSYVGYHALGFVFLLAILVVASFAKRGPIFFAAIVSSIVWNYFFIPPTFTFVITSSEDIMMVISFFVAASVSGFLTSRIRKQSEFLAFREERSRSLYELGKGLSSAKNAEEIRLLISSIIDRQFSVESITLLSDSQGKLERHYFKRLTEKDFAVAEWVFDHGKSAGWSTQTLSASPCLCHPMKGSQGVIGVHIMYPTPNRMSLTLEQETFLQAVLDQAGIAIERLRLADKAQKAKVYEVSEKLHQTLINSVSHELRTPITALVGITSALSDPETNKNEKTRMALLSDLKQSAQRLDRVVENLLDMSRLEKGSLHLNKEWFGVKDLIEDVKSQIGDELKDRELLIQGDEDALMEGDFKLLHHTFSNLIMNAVRYSPAGSPLQVTIRSKPTSVLIQVSDQGAGIPDDLKDKLFEKFYRLPGTPAGGLGLGLSIVKNIVELHGGRVWARNREDTHGAIFECEFPVAPTPAALKEILR